MKPIRTLQTEIQVGIWENARFTVRIYETFSTAVVPYVRWRNNEGTLDFARLRLAGDDHAAILKHQDDISEIKSLCYDHL